MCSTDSRRVRQAFPIVYLSLGLLGCSTPQHSNTLIFGTTTKVAIDASQEPAGAFGVTIGYKRSEAVWMPLVANQVGSNGGVVPSTCSTDDCRKFEGRTGYDGNPSGAGARDTYSVLATFSGEASASSQNPQATGGLAQYFATGIAARLLAQYGGAAVVNSAGKETSAAAIDAATKQVIDQKSKQIEVIVVKLSKIDGSIDHSKLNLLLQKDPANGIPDAIKTDLKAKKQLTEFRSYLFDGPESIQDAIYNTLDQI